MLVAALCQQLPAALPRFMPLGDIPGGDFRSRATDISSDGSVIVGASVIDETEPDDQVFEAFRWTAETGLIGLGDLAGGVVFSFASAVSPDGSVVVGASSSEASLHYSEAFRWSAATGMVAVGDLPGGFDHHQSYAADASANGAVIVGRGSSEAAINAETFRWTENTGILPLGDLPDGDFGSYATGVSADGSVVVGGGGSATGVEAYRWTAGTGMVGLGNLSQDVSPIYSEAEAVSADGLVVVGRSNSEPGTEAFRWTAQTGMVGLGIFPGGEFSLAYDVSANGAVVVGGTANGFGDIAFVWTAADGMRDIADLLTGAGVDLTGWRLDEATAVSASGLIVVGTGINPDGNFEAWRADLTGLITVPEPSALALCLVVTVVLTATNPRRIHRSNS